MKLPKLNSAFTYDVALIVIFILLGITVHTGFYIAAVPFVIILSNCSISE